MHASVLSFIAERVGSLGLASRSVFEVGSYDVNGSARPYFRGDYRGLDMRAGPGVDVVGLASSLPEDDASVEVVVCTEMLEHDPAFWRSVPEMARVLVPGGVLLLTTRGIGFPLHEYPSDYWRFTREGIRLLVEGAGLRVDEVLDDPQAPGVFCVATKPC